MRFIFVVLVLLTIIANIAMAVIFIKRKIKNTSESDIPINIHNEEINIEILASFQSLKFLPRIFSISHNNANPKLILTNSEIKFRVFIFGLQSKDYSSIEEVDYYSGLGTELIIFEFKDSIFNFSANLYKKNRLYSVLRILNDKQIPLSKKSEKFLSSYQIVD